MKLAMNQRYSFMLIFTFLKRKKKPVSGRTIKTKIALKPKVLALRSKKSEKK